MDSCSYCQNVLTDLALELDFQNTPSIVETRMFPGEVQFFQDTQGALLFQNHEVTISIYQSCSQD